MGREIDLEPVSSQNETDSQKRVFGVIEAGLEGPGDASTKAAALADDLRTLGAAQKSRGEAIEFIDDLCVMVVDIAHLTPPDHLWQDTLVQVVQSLQQTDGHVGELEEVQDLDWKGLPQLATYMRDKWFDPTELDDYTAEEVSQWKNLNSFAARLTTDTFAPWLSFPIWQLRSALEEELDKGLVLECRVWVATEWILRCGEIVFKDLASKEELDQDTAEALKTGSLCSEVAPLSLERLAFWEKRLVKMLGEKEAPGLSDELPKRVSEAAEKMREFESRYVP